jgi:hypothetical protein
VVCSLALQFNAPLETIRHALLRDSQGIAASQLGRALDLFADNNKDNSKEEEPNVMR